jgi:hypothetical protein
VADDKDVPVTGTDAGVDRFEAILRDTSWFMDALLAARQVGPPDWLIGAGVVRNIVWDHLHGFGEPTPLADVDLVFFDSTDTSEGRECQVEEALRTQLPGLPWEARNQAAVHLWYPQKFGYEVEPFTSTTEAVASWPESATAVGVRLGDDDDLTVVAPCGLDDLLGMVHRRNPARVTVEEYERRLATKRIAERWPRVTIIR